MVEEAQQRTLFAYGCSVANGIEYPQFFSLDSRSVWRLYDDWWVLAICMVVQLDQCDYNFQQCPRGWASNYSYKTSQSNVSHNL